MASLRRVSRTAIAGSAALLFSAACFERGDRWYLDTETPSCDAGQTRCSDQRLQHCIDTGQQKLWELAQDCAADGQVCAASLAACTHCIPGDTRCDGQTVLRCDALGQAYQAAESCDPLNGTVCRSAGCLHLCSRAAEQRSNVGCEYWAADLDNATISDVLNAAAQQFAVVLSNPQPDVPATVVIEQDEAEPGEPSNVVTVAEATIPPFSLRVFKLGPREVDGSEPGTFNTGTGTALSRAAYRIRSSVPLVAYQFNPLENVNVFSNDASLLKPVEALTPSSSNLEDAYVALGWPQTIAATDDPRTNFSSEAPINLRAFLTIIGTRPQTHVRVTPTTRVIRGGPVAETKAGGTIELELGPFEVLNLETGDFNADFSGTKVAADGPVVVFSGNEASDAPFFSDLSRRRCCADHLEEQLDPIRTAGRSFVATVSPNRAEALVLAGAKLTVGPQPEYFRVLAVTDTGARVETTLAGDSARFSLTSKGSFIDLSSTEDFAIVSDAPVMLASVSPSQDAIGIPTRLPGGDPSLLLVPPVEQFRDTYVFLIPDKYSFDFVRIIAPPDAAIVFDGEALESLDGCSLAALPIPKAASADSAATLARQWAVYRCQLSFPEVDPELASPANLSPGLQNDGVHRISSDRPIGVLADGFDAFVSYAYAAGTELNLIVPE